MSDANTPDGRLCLWVLERHDLCERDCEIANIGLLTTEQAAVEAAVVDACELGELEELPEGEEAAIAQLRQDLSGDCPADEAAVFSSNPTGDRLWLLCRRFVA